MVLQPYNANTRLLASYFYCPVCADRTTRYRLYIGCRLYCENSNGFISQTSTYIKVRIWLRRVILIICADKSVYSLSKCFRMTRKTIFILLFNLIYQQHTSLHTCTYIKRNTIILILSDIGTKNWYLKQQCDI